MKPRTQKAARKKRGQVKTLASDGLQPLMAPLEKRVGIKHSTVDHRLQVSRQERMTPAQEEALSWVTNTWQSPSEIVDRVGVSTMAVYGRLRCLAKKGLIERDHETGAVRLVARDMQEAGVA